MTLTEIEELKAQGYKYWKVTSTFGKREMPYFCYAKTEKEALATFYKIMGKKYLGIKHKSIRETMW